MNDKLFLGVHHDAIDGNLRNSDILQVQPEVDRPVLTGLSIDMTDFSSGTIVLGPGISFGKEHIIGLHVGVAFTTAATLKRGLELGRSYETDTLDIAALTEDRFKQGWFVSLSYVISKQGKE